MSSLSALLKKGFHKEPVLLISAVCALVSMVLAPPSAAYLAYMDWKVLSLLFCLMAVVAGFQECHLFDLMGQRLLFRCSSLRTLCLILVLLPFFSSMLITNDVALITFVPFAILVLGRAGRGGELIPVVVLQTVAANLGSMATPVGNPQSLYLYNHFQVPIGEYFALLLPLTAISFCVLTLVVLLRKSAPIHVHFSAWIHLHQPGKLFLFCLLFLLCILCVLRILNFRLMLGGVLVCLLLFDRALLKRVDYFLLLTFVCFFLFSGNLGQLGPVRELLTGLLEKNAMLTSILASQIISNVPAAVLLAGFTDNAAGLLAGTNIGGLGTPIASLASLISMKYYLRSPNARPRRYLAVFLFANLVGLVLLAVVASLHWGPFPTV